MYAICTEACDAGPWMFIETAPEQIRQCHLEPDEGAYECCDAEKAEGNIDLIHDHRDFGLSAHERNVQFQICVQST